MYAKSAFFFFCLLCFAGSCTFWAPSRTSFLMRNTWGRHRIQNHRGLLLSGVTSSSDFTSFQSIFSSLVWLLYHEVAAYEKECGGGGVLKKRRRLVAEQSKLCIYRSASIADGSLQGTKVKHATDVPRFPIYQGGSLFSGQSQPLFGPFGKGTKERKSVPKTVLYTKSGEKKLERTQCVFLQRSISPPCFYICRQMDHA